MSDDVDVSATFDTAYVYLTLSGDGSGEVVGSAGGLSCPDSCYESYLPGTQLTLTATQTDSTVFTGWSGDCAGTAATCELVLDDDLHVGAAFDTGRVFVRTTGDGFGTVTSTPGGITCPGDCRESFLPGTQVTFAASPGDDISAFVGWAGDCTGTGPCVVDAGTDPSVTARFETARLWVDRIGGGFGTVTSEPAGIDCGEDCTEAFLPGSTITLTATAHAGGTFAGWSGDCTGLGTCVLPMDGERTVNAWFNPPGVAGKIVYECNADICVMNEDGTDARNLTHSSYGEYAPSLSPDGTTIVFMAHKLPDNPDNNFEIVTMKVDGSDLTQVTHSEGSTAGQLWHNYDPDWSPDGSKIVFAGKRAEADRWQQIFTINADGTDETMITPHEFNVRRDNPVWSPDGTKIAYTWWGGIGQDIHVVNPDGTGDVNISPSGDFADDRSAAWSPDGSRIAFTTTRYTGATDIWVMGADGADLTRVTDHPAADESPTWSPDGEWIAFASGRGGSYDIWAVLAPPPGGHADGVTEDGLVQLTRSPGSDLDPYWAGNDGGQVVHQLSVKKTGKGKGVVDSSPSGIACGRDCVETFAAGTSVVLTARPAPGSVLAGWNRPCVANPTSNSCVMRVDDAIKVKVRFSRAPDTSAGGGGHRPQPPS